MNLHDSDADDDWEELRKKYGRAGGQADPSARLERFAAALKRLRMATPRSAVAPARTASDAGRRRSRIRFDLQ